VIVYVQVPEYKEDKGKQWNVQL